MAQYLIALIYILIASHAADPVVENPSEVKFVSYDELQSIIDEKSGEKTLVINFWATWCVPCVKELPVFEALQAEGEFELLYVSLDFERKIDSKLKPFIEENPFLDEHVVVLDQSNSNEWIPQVNSSWSGAIPATLVISKEGKKFHEGNFTTLDDLKSFINH